MGGKSRIYDPMKLQSIYLESRQFEKRSDSILHEIYKEIAKLNDPMILGRLSTENQESTKVMISNITDAITQLKEGIESTNRFINKKLSGAVQMAQDIQRKPEIDSEKQGIAFDLNLKK